MKTEHTPETLTPQQVIDKLDAYSASIENSISKINDAIIKIDKLKAINAELLQALKRIAEGAEMNGSWTHAETIVRYQKIAGAAIAKAEGL